MIKSNLVPINCKASPTMKYIACWDGYELELIEVELKRKTSLEVRGITHVNFSEENSLMLYSTSTVELVIYDIRFKMEVKRCKTQDRIVKALFLYPEPILMTLSSRGQFEESYQHHKLIRQIKGNLWDDERHYDFVYSKKHKLLILALKNGKLLFKGKEPLAEVYIHTPFHSLTLSPNEMLVSAICKFQVFIYEIFSEKRLYLQLLSAVSMSWLGDDQIVALQSFNGQKVISVWNTKKEVKVREKVVSEFAWKMTGEKGNTRCLYLTPIDESTKGRLIEWFPIQELLGEYVEVGEDGSGDPFDFSDL